MDLNALSLTHVIPFQGFARRYAVASLGDEVFVAAYQKGVEVYDTGTIFQRCLSNPGLGLKCFGLAACAHNNCLYASNLVTSSIYRVDLSGSSAVKTWSVGSHPRGLSVNKAHNVVVACYGANKLLEYTTDGSLVREISLQQAGLTNPCHAVQLSTGDYVVSQRTSPGVVSVVGVDGRVVHRYDQSQPSNVGQMNHPAGLAVTKDDNILVADCRNHRILFMNSSLSSSQVLALSVDKGIQGPLGLCLDESRGRLYVSERSGGRVLVFDSKAVNH